MLPRWPDVLIALAGFVTCWLWVLGASGVLAISALLVGPWLGFLWFQYSRRFWGPVLVVLTMMAIAASTFSLAFPLARGCLEERADQMLAAHQEDSEKVSFGSGRCALTSYRSSRVLTPDEGPAAVQFSGAGLRGFYLWSEGGVVHAPGADPEQLCSGFVGYITSCEVSEHSDGWFIYFLGQSPG